MLVREVRTEYTEKHTLFSSAAAILYCILRQVTSSDSQTTKLKLCWDQVSPRELGLSAVVLEPRQQSLTVPVVQFVLSRDGTHMNEDKMEEHWY